MAAAHSGSAQPSHSNEAPSIHNHGKTGSDFTPREPVEMENVLPAEPTPKDQPSENKAEDCQTWLCKSGPSKARRKILTVMYSNCDQFINKRDELSMIVSTDKPDLIFLTEVIPKSQRLPIHPALVSLRGYTLFLNFNISLPNLGRRGKRGIGICIATHLQIVEVVMSHQPLVEQL